jgi:hypothetical protein
MAPACRESTAGMIAFVSIVSRRDFGHVPHAASIAASSQRAARESS